ncbi:MAG: hypothetical protein KDB61_01510, partial [Planctomycetes bacterium]|nr:hypothetical protein [Planctomycetota bacterium]
MCHRPLFTGLVLAVALSLPHAWGQETAESTSQGEQSKTAIEEGVRLLLSYQERYRMDRPVGRIPDDQLKEWQAKESARLEKARKPGKRPAQEWPYEGVYRVGMGSIPSGYRVGGTAIVCEALVRAPGYRGDTERVAAVDRGLAFILGRLESDESLAPGPKQGYDVRGWAHAYGLNLLLILRKENLVPKDQAEAVEKMIPHLIHCLEVNALENGGWNYAGDGPNQCSPFMTGPTLLFLYEARAQGFEVPEELVSKALNALEKGRDSKTGAYGYAGPRREKMAASSGRAAVAELALLRAGKSDPDRLRMAVMGFFDNWDELFA